MSHIASVECFPVRIPAQAAATQAAAAPTALPGSTYHRKPHRGLLYAPDREALFIKMTTADGHVGWGESLASVAPRVAAQIIADLLTPQLIGQDPLLIDPLWHALYHSMRDRGHFTGFFIDALAGCDTALWDLRGRILHQPVSTLLGGAFTDQVRVYASGAPGANPAARAAAAQALVAAGFDAIKLHLTAGAADTLATVAAVRDAVGPAVALMVDAHNTYDLATAIQVGRALEGFDVLFFEAPIDPEDISGLAQLTRALQVRIATGESERSRFQFRDRLLAGAVDVVQPDLGYVGPTEMRRIAQLADTFHVPLAPHLSAGLGVCIAATLHLAAAQPNLLIVEHHPAVLALANTLLETPLIRTGATMAVPRGPGLGVAPDEAKLRAWGVAA